MGRRLSEDTGDAPSFTPSRRSPGRVRLAATAMVGLGVAIAPGSSQGSPWDDGITIVPVDSVYAQWTFKKTGPLRSNEAGPRAPVVGLDLAIGFHADGDQTGSMFARGAVRRRRFRIGVDLDALWRAERGDIIRAAALTAGRELFAFPTGRAWLELGAVFADDAAFSFGGQATIHIESRSARHLGLNAWARGITLTSRTEMLDLLAGARFGPVVIGYRVVLASDMPTTAGAAFAFDLHL